MASERFVILIFGLSRMAIFAFEWFGMMLLPFKKSFPYADTILVPTGFPQWLWQWGNFDGVHYLTIAKSGYDGFGTQVFFPVYPLAVRFLTVLTGNYLLSGLIISNVAALVAGLLLFKLIKQTLGVEVGKWAILFLFFFPTSFFFGSVYSESLFLALVLVAFSSEGVVGAAAAALVSGTRLVGVFLAPALLFGKKFRMAFAVVPVGLVAYMLFLWSKFGNPLMFLTAQSAFQNSRATTLSTLVTPVQVIGRYLRILVFASPGHLDFWISVLELASFVLGVGVLGYLTYRRKLGKDYLIYAWGAVLLPSFSGTFSSMPRYLLGVFPVFIGLAMIRDWRLKAGLLGFFVILLAVLTVLFTRGYFVG